MTSISGNIDFRLFRNQAHARLSQHGLRLGDATTASANLDVSGNALVTGSLTIGNSVIGGANLNIHGTFAQSVGLISSSTQLRAMDSSLSLVNSMSGNIVLTLPYAGNVTGQMRTIKKIHGSHAVRIFGGGNQIDRYGVYEMGPSEDDYASLSVISNGKQWYITSASDGPTVGTVAASNLLGWWSFDSNSGLRVDDKSSYGNHGTMNGGMSSSSNIITGQVGSGLMMDGVDDHISVSDNVFDITRSLTLMAWVKTSTADINSRTQHVFSKRESSGNCPLQFAIVQSSAKIKIYTKTVGVGAKNNESSDTITPDAWNFIVYVRDAVRRKMTFYINGVQDSGGWQSDTLTKISPSDVTLKIGCIGMGNGKFFGGLMDEVRIYNKPLDPNEIQAIYQSSALGL